MMDRTTALALGLALLPAAAGCGDQAASTGPVPGAPPTVFDVAPDTVRAANAVQVTGVNFSSALEDLTVSLAGQPGAVGDASRTELFFTAPSPRGLGCGPARPADLTVAVDGRASTITVPLATALPVDLQPGDAERVTEAGRVPCHRFPARETRYLITAFNPDPTPDARVSVQFRGQPVDGETAPDTADAVRAAAAGPDAAYLAPDGGIDVSALPDASETPFPVDVQEIVRERRGHQGILRRSLDYLERHGDRLARGGDASADAGAPGVRSAPPPEPGEVRSFRVPFLGAADLCASYRQVEARAVHVGEHLVIFEDVDAPLAGQMDGTIEQLGTHYEDVMHPILTENFGDPLALDARLDDDGRVYMLMTPMVNDFDAASFVWPGDFASRSACGSSDGAEIFYFEVPTTESGGFTGDTPEAWYWSMRGVVMHEMKHIVSYAERLSRDAASAETEWLEEGTAMIAEELYAREVYGYGQFGNTGYRESLYCELRPTVAECRGKPQVMYAHWFLFYTYQFNVDQLTPLGPVSADDQSWYGSSWNLVRWAVDHSGRDESAVLTELTQATSRTGAENLSAAVGMPWERIVGYWTTSLATDDHPDVDLSRDVLKSPGWDSRDIFASLSEDLFLVFPFDFPLFVHRRAPDRFEFQNDALHGASASFVELDGRTDFLGFTPQNEAEILKIQGPNGGPPADHLRSVIVRIE